MTPEEVLRLRDLVWGPAKLRNLASPTLGEGPRGQTWADILIVAEEIVEDALRRAMTSPVQGERAQIGRRCAINDAVRKATVYPGFYSMPLYVSEGFLADVAAAETALPPFGASSRRRRSVARPACCEEHVVPIAVHCSGTKIIADPETNLVKLRRTLLGPICLLTRDEDAALPDGSRKRSERPNRPFRRYLGIADIRRTDDGTRIDPETFSFRDHLRIMSSHPAYATAVALFHPGARTWRDRVAAMRGC
jgi:hypothetical protein